MGQTRRQSVELKTAPRARGPLALLDHLPDPIVRFDAMLQPVYRNRPAKELETMLAALSSADESTRPPAIRAQLEQVLRTGTPLEVEHTLPASGGLRHLQVRVVPEHAGDLVVGVIALVRDVTQERVRQREADRAAERTARLQATAAALTQSLTPESVAEVMLRDGRAALGAAAGALALVDGDALVVVRATGWGGQGQVLDGAQPLPLDAREPLAEAVRSGEPVWLESRAAFHAHFTVEAQHLGLNAWLAMPLVVDGRVLGALGYAFERARLFSREARDLALSLARQCASSLERARLYAAERRAREEAEAAEAALTFLEEASTMLVGSLDVDATLRSVARVAVPALADLCVVDLAIGGEVRRAAVADEDATLAPLVAAAQDLRTARAWPLLERVLHTGEPEMIAELGDAQLEAIGAQPADRLLAREAGLRSVMIVPLRARGHTIGALSLAARGDRSYQANDLALAEELARRAALCVENARLYEAETEARRSAERVALRTARLQATTALLARSVTAAQIAAAVVEEGGPVVSASGGAIWRLCDADTALERMHAWGDAGLEGEEWARILAEGETPIAESVRTGQPVWHIEHGLVCAPLEVDGRVLGALAFAFDVQPAFDEDDGAFVQTLARLAAQALERARLYEEAERARADLAQAVRARDEFLSIASHELKTPLSALHLHVEGLRRTLRRSGAPPTQEQLHPKLEAIEEQIGRQTKLVNQLLDVSRITAGRLELELEEVDLAELTRSVAARFAIEVQKAGCELTLDAAEPVMGRWDRMRLDQVITNLITNALKYGHGRPIHVAVRGSESSGMVSVRDHGIGIAPEHQQRIFERFERAVSGRHYGGFGLGLWISREIVEALGGGIAVESKPGEGATFVVALPNEWEATPIG